MGRIGDRLAARDWTSPPSGRTPGVVMPFKWVKVSGNYVRLGHGPLDGGDVLVRGKVGADVSAERGYDAARLTVALDLRLAERRAR